MRRSRIDRADQEYMAGLPLSNLMQTKIQHAQKEASKAGSAGVPACQAAKPPSIFILNG